MTIAPFENAGVPAVLQPAQLPEGIATLRAWASVASEAAQLVAPLINTAFVPDVFRPKVDPRATDAEKRQAHETAVATATAAVLYGAGLGLDPLQALSSIHVVKGKPGLYAETMVALLKGAGHEIGVELETDALVRVWGRRKGSETIERAEFSIQRAASAGYVAQNPKYKSDPRSMLYARAVSILCRRLAPEVLKGIASAEETIDEPDPDTRPTSRTVQRAPARAALAAPQAPAGAATPPPARQAPSTPPTADDEYAAAMGAPTAVAEPAQIAEADWRAINERFRVLGVNGEGKTAARLAVITNIIGRPITRGNELLAREAADVLANLADPTGIDIVSEVLGWEQTQAPTAEPTAPAETAPAAGYDPTSEPDWPGAQQYADDAARDEAAADQ